MKRFLFFIAISLICASASFAQEELYQNQLNVIKEALNTKDTSLLDSLLAEDCTILGNSGNLLKPSLKAVFGTLANNTIEEMLLVNSERTENGGVILTYKIKYSVLGEKDACFSFNENGKIIQLDYLSGAKAQSVKKVSAKKAGVPIGLQFLFAVGCQSLGRP